MRKIVVLFCILAVLLTGCGNSSVRSVLDDINARKRESVPLAEMRVSPEMPDYTDRMKEDGVLVELPRATTDQIPWDRYVPVDDCPINVTLVQIPDAVIEELDRRIEVLKDLMDRYINDNTEIYGYPYCAFYTKCQEQEDVLVLVFAFTTSRETLSVQYTKSTGEFEVITENGS